MRRRAGWAADAKVREERAAEAAAEATAREKRLNMKYKVSQDVPHVLTGLKREAAAAAIGRAWWPHAPRAQKPAPPRPTKRYWKAAVNPTEQRAVYRCGAEKNVKLLKKIRVPGFKGVYNIPTLRIFQRSRL